MLYRGAFVCCEAVLVYRVEKLGNSLGLKAEFTFNYNFFEAHQSLKQNPIVIKLMNVHSFLGRFVL